MQLTVFFDVLCPYAWRTSRWLDLVVAQRPSVVIEWRYFSLEQINTPADSDWKIWNQTHDYAGAKEGWENFDLYKTIPLLTLNSFGFNYLNNSLSEGQYKQNIVYYETSKDKILPDVRKLIPVDSNTHKEFYGQSSSV